MSDAWSMSASARVWVSPNMSLRREKTRSAAAELGVKEPTICEGNATRGLNASKPQRLKASSLGAFNREVLGVGSSIRQPTRMQSAHVGNSWP